MPKFRKKPVVVDAVQWKPDKMLLKEIIDFGGGSLASMRSVSIGRKGDNLIVKTLEGDMIASPGDWIIKGVNGELYPCKPDIFEKTYEPIE